MISVDTLYIGIDPTSGNKEFGYAVLDSSLNLIALEESDLEELVSFLKKQNTAIVAVNSPSNVNHGLVKKILDEKVSAPGRKLRGVDIRLVEYELREKGISVAGTPSREEFCPTWMQVGFALYQKLSELGYKSFGKDDVPLQVLETHPYACFCVLVEGIPFSKPTLEGRLQRQLILNDKGLRINDAMGFFEEVTRFKLIKGILPTDLLYSPEQLDVLVAAYTAWLAANRPDEVIKLGDVGEGQMILPTRELSKQY